MKKTSNITNNEVIKAVTASISLKNAVGSTITVKGLMYDEGEKVSYILTDNGIYGSNAINVSKAVRLMFDTFEEKELSNMMEKGWEINVKEIPAGRGKCIIIEEV